MTDPEINRAVAEECGWTKCVCGDEHCGAWFAPGSDKVFLGYPNYTESLDACRRDFENTFSTDDEIENYRAQFISLLTSEDDEQSFMQKLLLATAAERCQAFLRLRGKWRE